MLSESFYFRHIAVFIFCVSLPRIPPAPAARPHLHTVLVLEDTNITN